MGSNAPQGCDSAVNFHRNLVRFIADEIDCVQLRVGITGKRMKSEAFWLGVFEQIQENRLACSLQFWGELGELFFESVCEFVCGNHR